MQTTNKSLNRPDLASPSWGTPLNDNAAYIDKALGSFTTVSGTSGSITLTDTQYQNMCLKSDTAAFLANVTFVVPSGVGGQWIVVNQSATNTFELRVKNAASATYVSIENGETRTVYSDGTTVFFTDIQAAPIPDQNLQVGGSFATTGATCSGTNATVTFATAFTIEVGNKITIRDVTPTGYNGIWTVTASSSGSVTFVVPATLGVQTASGRLYYGEINASSMNLTGRGYLAGTATQAEAEAGTDNTLIMTPLRVRNSLSATGTAPIFAARAWVNMDGTPSASIRTSENVSSVAKLGTGSYRVNYINALPYSNYSVVAALTRSGDFTEVVNLSTISTTSLTFTTLAYDGGIGDSSTICLAMFA